MSTSRSIVLALECSNRRVGAALWGPQGLIAQSGETPAEQLRKHGADLAPAAQELLKNSGLQVRDLKGIGVALGPGSWTGLRVGIALAKAMAWGASVELTGVSSFEALALQVSRTLKAPGRLLTLRNAYSEGFFAAQFLCKPSEAPERLAADAVIKPDALPAWADTHSGPGVSVCGDAVCLTALENPARERGWTLLSAQDEVEPATLAELAYARLEKGEGLRTPEQIHLLGPLYLRASDPELKFQRKPA